ncbi:MAG: hypothetical protein ACKO1F_01980 [Flammeovirgaceae bacterium]
MKAINATSNLACLLIITGAVFSIQHFEGSAILLSAGAGLFFISLGLKSFEKRQTWR